MSISANTWLHVLIRWLHTPWGITIGWCSFLCLLCLILYVFLIVFEAKQAIDKSPLKAMYICDVHGPMPQDATHVLFEGAELDHQISPDGKTLRAPVRVCPICFETSIKVAKEKM